MGMPTNDQSNASKKNRGDRRRRNGAGNATPSGTGTRVGDDVARRSIADATLAGSSYLDDLNDVSGRCPRRVRRRRQLLLPGNDTDLFAPRASELHFLALAGELQRMIIGDADDDEI